MGSVLLLKHFPETFCCADRNTLKLEFDMARHRKTPEQDTVLKRVNGFHVRGTSRFAVVQVHLHTIEHGKYEKCGSTKPVCSCATCIALEISIQTI
jgi:hypothetical protein